MSLFPIVSVEAKHESRLNHASNSTEWLSNNASYHQRDVLEPHQPYGKYATQAEFLRAAERYLESSSDSDVDDAGTGKQQKGPPGPAETSRLETSLKYSGRVASKVPARLGRHERSSRSPPPICSSDTDGSNCRERHGSDGRGRKRNHRFSRSSSHAKSTRHKRSSKGAYRRGKSKKYRKRSHRRGSSSSSGSDDSDSPSDTELNDNKQQREREKILRLERAAAAAGLAPRQAAALAATKPILKGAAPQAGELYYDTRGDLDNVVYECLYGGNVASYYRTDSLGLSYGSRVHRLLPGQVERRGCEDNDDDGDGGGNHGSVAAARYFGSVSVAAERSRRLRRMFLSEIPVLPGAGAHRRRSGRGSRGAGEVRRGWLFSQVEGPTIRGRIRGNGEGDSGLKMAMPLPSFLSLQDPAAAAVAAGDGGWNHRQAPSEAQATVAADGESVEEWVLRRTREFNVAVRETPQNVQLWLRFAAFQDTNTRLLVRKGGQVAGAAAAAEKKLSILERALESHPGHPYLQRAVMTTYEALLQPEELMARWERLLRRSPGESSLWRDYLSRLRSAFALTKLSSLQVAYGNAMHVLASERARQQRQLVGDRPEDASAAVSAVWSLDRELVRLVLEVVELELMAGACEVAVGRVQALTEFHCFAPGSMDRGTGSSGLSGGVWRLPAGALLRLFECFWESGAPRVGEDGARGWAAWYRRENDVLWVAKTGGGSRQDDEDGHSDSQEGDGWTGWTELPPLAPPESAGVAEAQGQVDLSVRGVSDLAAAGGVELGEGAVNEEEEDEEEEQEGVQLTEEELLAQLGLRLDEQLEEMQRQGVPPDILSLWLCTERRRSAREWKPLRPRSGTQGSPRTSSSPQRAAPHQVVSGRGGGDEGGDDAVVDAQRVVKMEDIRSGIFPIEDPDLKLDLILCCLCLLGVPLMAQGPAEGARGAGSVPLLSSYVGCCPQSFWRLLPQQAVVAACHACLPQGLAAAVSAVAGGVDNSSMPWFLRDESRRSFVAQLLRSLVTDGPYACQPQLCMSYLLVEASSAYDVDAATGTTPPQSLSCADRARESARSLLSRRRTSVAVLMALAALEEAVRQPRAARRARDAALAGAAVLPVDEQALLPLLVHQYVEAERAAARSLAGGPMPAALEPALRAHHVLCWFLTSWLPAMGCRGGGGSGADAVTSYTLYKTGRPVTKDDVAAARRGFESAVPGLLAVRGGALDAPSASSLYLGGLFEALTARLFTTAGGGLVAALNVHTNATAAVPAAVRQLSGYHEALAVSYCGLVVSELHTAAGGEGIGSGAGGVVQPARARVAVLQALEQYPHNPQLLALRVQLGRLAGGGAQCRLRRDLSAAAAALRRFAEGSLESLAESLAAEEAGGAPPGLGNAASAAAAVWWAQLAAEAALPHPDPRVSRLFECAATARHLAACLPVWIGYLAHEASAGRMSHVKRVFLRAVREAPLCKELWMVGMSVLGQVSSGCDIGSGGTQAVAGGGTAGLLTSREVAELMGVAADKGVRLRTDVYEVMLQHLAEQE